VEELPRVRPLHLIALATAATIVVAASAVVLWRWSNGSRSELASWLEAVATVAAVVAAVVAATYAANAFRIETKREVDREAERAERARFERSSQARRVRLSPVERVSASGRQFEYMDVHYRGFISNQSDDAVHDVEVVLLVDPPTAVAGGYDRAARETFRTLAAEEHRIVDIRTRILWDPGSPEMRTHEIQASASFTDMSKLRWHRDHEHRLSSQAMGHLRD
jgi:hypothetical protein